MPARVIDGKRISAEYREQVRIDAAAFQQRTGITPHLVAVLVGDDPASAVIERRHWWNALVGNPLGYLPQATPISRIDFGFSELELLNAGPAWMRGWPFAFFLVLVIVSILIKVIFRIE